MDLDRYLDDLASSQPTPGGGSAATLVGALSVALCAMVARISLASPKLVAVHAEAAAIADDADELRRRFVELRPQDEAAFRAVVAAQGLPRSTVPEQEKRRTALQQALAGAAETPLETARLAADALALALRTADLGNANVMSDVECALHFARAAFDASAANIAVNHRYISAANVVAEQRERLAALARAAREAETHAAAVVRASTGSA